MEKGKYNILNFKLYYIIQGKNMVNETKTVDRLPLTDEK